MPSYRLKYFDSRGRGEVPRLLFAIAGQEYEDVRFSDEMWPAEKPKTPLGQVPVLEIDGKPYSESGAISRYLAKTFNLYGKDNIENLQVDQVLGIVTDIMSVLVNIYFEKDETRKDALIKEAKEEKIPRYYNMFEKILSSNGGTGFFVGEKITLADLAVFDKIDTVNVFVDIPLETFPLLKKSVDMVGAEPRIKAWVEKRPKTEF